MRQLSLIFFFLVGSCVISQAQEVKLLTIDQLNSRISAGGDTTYIVNFWATWCSPCIEELPYFEKLQADLKDQKVKVMLVSVDFKSKYTSGVIPMAQRLKLKSEVFLLDETNQQEYIDRIDKSWSGAIPATVFINKSKNKREFYEKEFKYAELLNRYHLIQ